MRWLDVQIGQSRELGHTLRAMQVPTSRHGEARVVAVTLPSAMPTTVELVGALRELATFVEEVMRGDLDPEKVLVLKPGERVPRGPSPRKGG